MLQGRNAPGFLPQPEISASKNAFYELKKEFYDMPKRSFAIIAYSSENSGTSAPKNGFYKAKKRLPETIENFSKRKESACFPSTTFIRHFPFSAISKNCDFWLEWEPLIACGSFSYIKKHALFQMGSQYHFHILPISHEDPHAFLNLGYYISP
jgi:hypothetical protein